MLNGFFLLVWNRYEGGKEKGLFEGYGKAIYIGGHSYTVSRLKTIKLIVLKFLG